MFHNDEAPEEPKERCECCGLPAFGESWTRWLCERHFYQWMAEAPTAGELEAQAKPEEVEAKRRGQFIDVVLLNEGVLPRMYRSAISQWVLRNRKAAA